MPSQTTLTGAAGEYFVMAELLRRNYISALAPHGVQPLTLSSRTLKVQDSAESVKSRRERGSDGGWHMNEKHERTRAKHLFYCFVDFGKTVSDRPSTFVVPSNIVAKVVAASHKKWLADPGKMANGARI